VIDREDLEVIEYGKVFLGKVESPTAAFSKRIDKIKSKTDNQQQATFFEDVKSKVRIPGTGL
jgi:hypothetical protein